MIRTLIFNSDPVFNDEFVKFIKTQKSMKLVGTSSNGIDAIKLFSKHLPELVILDSDLPELNGIFLVREMSQLDSSVKIIFTTSGVSKDALKIISKFSNLVILYKPFDSKMFLEKLDELKF